MKSSVEQICTHLLPLSYENWLSMVKKPIHQRPCYALTQGTLHIGQAVARFLGVMLDEDEYYNRLYELVHEDIPGIILLSQNQMNHALGEKPKQSLLKVLQLHREWERSLQRLIALLDGEGLLLQTANRALHRKIREAFHSVLMQINENERDDLENRELERILFDVITWSFTHLKSVLDGVNPELSMPKILWYGEAKKSHQYFLFFLLSFGCDLLLFNPSGEDPFAIIDKEQRLAFVYHFPQTQKPKPFPVVKRKRKTTVAYRAEKEIEKIFRLGGSYFYKPWQLRDYLPSSITLKTTYDELFQLAKEKALVRPGFTVKNESVVLPVLFAKVQGISRERKKYWEQLHLLTECENSMFIRELPFTQPVNNDFRFYYRQLLGPKGELSIDKMLDAPFWKYRHLPIGLQKGIAAAIKGICYHPSLKPLHYETENDVKVYLFTQAMQMPHEVVRMMQKFDYSQEIPKLIIYNNGMCGTLSRSDAALLLLLNQFGFDIIIFHPAGQSDIENYMEGWLFDTHWLDDVVFEQEYKEPSFLRKFTWRELLKGWRGGGDNV